MAVTLEWIAIKVLRVNVKKQKATLWRASWDGHPRYCCTLNAADGSEVAPAQTAIGHASLVEAIESLRQGHSRCEAWRSEHAD